MHIAPRHPHGVRHRLRQRMQDLRAVRVDHALGLAGGARGVAHGARLVLVHLRVVEAPARRFQERLVVLHAGRHRLAGQRHDDHALDVDLVPELLEQRQQHVVDDQEAVLRVVGDEGDVVRREPQVERVQHAACDDRAEVGLVVGVVVPHQRGDPVAALQPRLGQRLGQQARPPVEIGVGVAVQRLVRHARDDLLRAEQLARPLQKMRQIERDAHHGGLHFTPPAPRLRARLAIQSNKSPQTPFPSRTQRTQRTATTLDMNGSNGRTT